MRRYLLFAAAAAVIAVLTAIALTATAQSVQWAGNYYIAVDQTATGPASVVGRHESWSHPMALTAFGVDEFADFAVRPRMSMGQFAPDNRYELLAVGSRRNGTYAASGYENEGAPTFEPTATRIAGIGTPYDVEATAEGFLVVAGRPGDEPPLTGDYRIAYRVEDKWSVVPGPDFRGGLFVDLAVSMHTFGLGQTPQLIAVGRLMDKAVFLPGVVVDGQPVFGAVEPIELPYLVTPISIEWTGAYFVVLGLDANGDYAFVYGRPGWWSESKMQLSGEVELTAFAAAPLRNVGKPAKHYDLLAIGRLQESTVTLTGEEFLGQFPTLVEKWAAIPGFEKPVLGSAPMATIATATITAGPNPFSDRSTVTLSVDREQPVLVEVFDAIGRRVTVLHNAMLSAGTTHSFTLDAAGLPGGVYHFRVSGVDFDESRQVTLVR
jgi:hypothetical protein